LAKNKRYKMRKRNNFKWAVKVAVALLLGATMLMTGCVKRSPDGGVGNFHVVMTLSVADDNGVTAEAGNTYEARYFGSRVAVDVDGDWVYISDGQYQLVAAQGAPTTFPQEGVFPTLTPKAPGNAGDSGGGGEEVVEVRDVGELWDVVMAAHTPRDRIDGESLKKVPYWIFLLLLVFFWENHQRHGWLAFIMTMIAMVMMAVAPSLPTFKLQIGFAGAKHLTEINFFNWLFFVLGVGTGIGLALWKGDLTPLIVILGIPPLLGYTPFGAKIGIGAIGGIFNLPKGEIFPLAHALELIGAKDLSGRTTLVVGVVGLIVSVLALKESRAFKLAQYGMLFAVPFFFTAQQLGWMWYRLTHLTLLALIILAAIGRVDFEKLVRERVFERPEVADIPLTWMLWAGYIGLVLIGRL
jgi:hypothetical protein